MKIKEEYMVPAVELGIELLRFALQALSNHPMYLDPQKLDLFLVSPTDTPGGSDEEDSK